MILHDFKTDITVFDKNIVNHFIDYSINLLSSISTIDVDIEKFLNKYREELLNFKQVDIIPDYGYTHNIKFMDTSIDLYWNVPKLLEDNLKVPIINFYTDYLFSLINIEDMDNPFASPASRDPICLAEIPMCIPNSCVIDGNHRIYHAYTNKIETLPVKMYSAKEHIKYLIPSSAFIFKICLNIMSYSLYVENKIDINELEKMLFK